MKINFEITTIAGTRRLISRNEVGDVEYTSGPVRLWSEDRDIILSALAEIVRQGAISFDGARMNKALSGATKDAEEKA